MGKMSFQEKIEWFLTKLWQLEVEVVSQDFVESILNSYTHVCEVWDVFYYT